MAILKNNLLFNHTYLNRLTSDNSIDADIPFSPGDIHQWYSELRTETIGAMVESWIAPMLSLLELELYPIGDGGKHAYLLTSTYDNQTPIGLCYVTPPGVNLDTTTKGVFWMAQAALAARRAEPPLRWVLLTNGDLWRLLDAQALRRYEAYVQIDVGALARGTSDPTALRVFYRCFHRNAFEKDEQGKTGLEYLLVESDHATDQAEKHLKDRVSGVDGIMAQLCLGLVRSTGKSKFSEAEREAIYRDATSLLYRMLFLLYAEARELLPIDHPNYAVVSMTRLVEVARQSQLDGLKHPEGVELWKGLKRLCTAIYESDPELNIPLYNGGLFDDGDHPYLRDGSIANQYLSRALYDLAYLSNSGGEQRIDYRDLSVRHLGNLYEGMIEYRLFVAEEPMLARRDKGGIIHFLAQTEAGGLRRNDQEIPAGSVYFAQSSGERRATGTYYTPEYIVDYIVSKTVVRSLEDRRVALEEKLKSWQDEIAAASSNEVIRMQHSVDVELLKFVEKEILTFTVCDPAMGSGHFLVNAAYHLAAFIVESLNLTQWDNPNLDLDPGNWRRRVAERCLYGVDLSEMAAELAKLSLWLATMAQGRPLSFLNHHLRHGNSLIGVRMEDLTAVFEEAIPTAHSRKEKKLLAKGQLSMLGDPSFSQHLNAAMVLLTKISEHITKSVSDIQSQETDYERARAELSPYRELANLVMARYFGLSASSRDFARIAAHLVTGTISLTDVHKHLLEQAKELADKWNFFHWDLEFIDPLLTQNGFNAIIGNPPYDELSEVTLGRVLDEKQYFVTTPIYANAVTGRVNLYRLFIARALSVLLINGFHSFIVPMSILGDRFTFELRKEILTKSDLLLIEAFPQKDDPNNRVFFDAKLPTCIYLLQNSPAHSEFRVRIHPGKEVLRSSPSCLMTAEQITRFDPGNLCIPQITQQEWDIVLKLVNSSRVIPLKDVATPTSGEIVFNQSFRKYLSENSRHTLVLRGGHVQRYELLDDPKQGTPVYIDREKYLSDSRPGTKAFDHLKHRVVYQECAALDNWRRIIATYLPPNNICGHKICYFINNHYDDFAFLAIFNSKLPEWFFRFISTTNSLAAYQVSLIPYPKIEFITHSSSRASSGEKNRNLYSKVWTKGDYTDILKHVEDCLHQQPEQSDVVHDLLAYLAKQMIEMNQQKQAESKRFLTWLESETGTSLEEVSGKSTLQNFLGDYQKGEAYLSKDQLLTILINNKRRLTVDPGERGFRQILERRYQESLDLLLPLKQRLTITDSLIDQIVYKLYGLTDEEIAIVEGRSK